MSDRSCCSLKKSDKSDFLTVALLTKSDMSNFFVFWEQIALSVFRNQKTKEEKNCCFHHVFDSFSLNSSFWGTLCSSLWGTITAKIPGQLFNMYTRQLLQIFQNCFSSQICVWTISCGTFVHKWVLGTGGGVSTPTKHGQSWLLTQ